MRSLIWTAVLVTALCPAVAGEVETVLDVELEGRKVLDGEADDRLRAIGGRAASENLALRVSAPDLWERQILEPIRAGAGESELTVEYVNALSDVVTIKGIPADQAEDPLETLKRITSNAKAHAAGVEEEAAPAQPAARQPASPGESSQRPDIERPAMDVPEMRVERPRAALPAPGSNRPADLSRNEASKPAVREREPAADQPPQSTEPAPEEPAPATEPGRPAETPAAETAAAPRTDGGGSSAAGMSADEEKERFQRLYNRGRDISGSLAAGELEKGDLVFTGDHRDVVVRRGLSSKAYWLDGELPEARVEHVESNKYRVVADAPEPESPEPSALPARAEEERERFEEVYNRGRSITESLAADELEPGDALYVGKKVSVVVRRSGVGLSAYWLGEPLRLDQPGIAHEKKNKYLVVGDVE